MNTNSNIRQHVLLLIFGCCLFTFLVIIAVAFYTFLNIQDTVRDKSDILEKNLSYSLGNFSESSIEERLAENVELRALYIDRELTIIGEDVDFLADVMSNIMKSPEQYNYQKVAELRELDDIYAGKPYLMYSPALLKQGISAELEHEIGVFLQH